MNAQTIFLVVGIGYAVFGVMLALVQRQEQREDRLKYLAVGFLVLGAGTFLQAGREVLPLVLAMWVGNLLSVLGLLLQWWGVQALTGHPPSRRERSAGVAVLLVTVALALVLQEPLRVIFGSLVYAVLFLLPAWTLMRWRRAYPWLRYMVIAGFVATACVFVVRAMRYIVNPDAEGVFARGNSFTAAYLVIYLAMLTTGFGVLLLSKASADRRVRETNRELTTILTTLPTGLCTIRQGQIVRANPAAHRMFDAADADLVGLPIGEVLPGWDRNVPESGSLAAEVPARRRSGQDFWVWLSARRIDTEDQANEAVLSMTDITEIKQLQDELLSQASTDDLTGLSNRRAFVTRGEAEVAAAQTLGKPLALAIVDVDGLKQINDELGHAAGDHALRAVARACRVAAKDLGLSGRLGGDEFAIILPGCDAGDGQRAMDALQTDLSAQPLVIKGSEVPLTTSIGVAEVMAHENFAQLLERADSRMYLVKKSGRNGIST